MPQKLLAIPLQIYTEIEKSEHGIFDLLSNHVETVCGKQDTLKESETNSGEMLTVNLETMGSRKLFTLTTFTPVLKFYIRLVLNQ